MVQRRAGALRGYQLVDDVALHLPDFEELLQRAVDRNLLVHLSADLDQQVSDDERAAARARLLRQLGLTEDDVPAWMATCDLDEQRLARLVQHQARLFKLRRWMLDGVALERNRRMVIEQLQLEGRYAAAADAAARRRRWADERPEPLQPTTVQRGGRARRPPEGPQRLVARPAARRARRRAGVRLARRAVRRPDRLPRRERGAAGAAAKAQPGSRPRRRAAGPRSWVPHARDARGLPGHPRAAGDDRARGAGRPGGRRARLRRRSPASWVSTPAGWPGCWSRWPPSAWCGATVTSGTSPTTAATWRRPTPMGAPRSFPTPRTSAS